MLKDEIKDLGWNSVFFFIFLVFTYSITKIGFVRYPIATWVFFYGALHYFYFKSKWSIAIVLLSAFVHFSYVFAIIPFLGVFFIGARKIFYVAVLVFSLLTPSLVYSNFSQFDSSEVEVGDAYGRRITGYSNLEYKNAREESFNQSAWYKKYRFTLFNYYLIALIAWILVFGNRMISDKLQDNLFSMIMLMAAFVHWGLAFESLGQRFTYVLSFFVFTYMARYFHLNKTTKTHWLVYIGLVPFLLYTIFDLRQLSQYWNVLLFVGNPVVFFVNDSYISLLEFVK